MADQLPAISSKRIFEKQITVGRGRVFVDLPSKKTFNVVLRGTGLVSCRVNLLGSNLPDSDSYVPLMTFDVSGLNVVTESKALEAPWAYITAEVITINGTAASLDAAVGV